MRITDSMKFSSIQLNLQRASQKFFDANERVVSGRRINSPSDDPAGSQQVLRLESLNSSIDQYERNMSRAQHQLETYDSVLDTATNIIIRAKELAIGANNATQNSGDRAMTAVEVTGLLEEMVSIANTRVDGSYIFAGYKTDTRPFDPSKDVHAGVAAATTVVNGSGVDQTFQYSYEGVQRDIVVPDGTDLTALAGLINADAGNPGVTASVWDDGGNFRLVLSDNNTGRVNNITVDAGTTLDGAVGTVDFSASAFEDYLYDGDSGTIEVGIDEMRRMQANITGDSVFKVAGGVDILKELHSLKVALETNDLAGIDTAIGTMDTALDQVVGGRTKAGTRLNEIDLKMEDMANFKLNVLTRISDVEDIDLAQAITEMTEMQSAYHAALGASAKLSQMSLLDFLR